MIEAQLVLATLVQHAHLELRSAPSLEFEWTITTRPKDPIKMRVEKPPAGDTITSILDGDR